MLSWSCCLSVKEWSSRRGRFAAGSAEFRAAQAFSRDLGKAQEAAERESPFVAGAFDAKAAAAEAEAKVPIELVGFLRRVTRLRPRFSAGPR